MKKFLSKTYDIVLVSTIIVSISVILLSALDYAGLVTVRHLKGTSNSPTFSSNTIALIVSKEPERFNFVTIQKKVLGADGLYKRIIGMPGDTIEIVNGVLYVNNKVVEEPYARYLTEEQKLSYNCEKVTLSYDEYYVLGDNRNLSYDSQEFGPIGTNTVSGVIVWSKDLRNTWLGDMLED